MLTQSAGFWLKNTFGQVCKELVGRCEPFCPFSPFFPFQQKLKWNRLRSSSDNDRLFPWIVLQLVNVVYFPLQHFKLFYLYRTAADEAVLLQKSEVHVWL